MSALRRGMSAACLAALLAAPAFAQYTVLDLGTLGGSASTATAINTRGDVVGFSKNATEQDRAFLVPAGGTMQDLGTFGGALGYAYAINDFGAVVGSAASASAGNPQRAFVWTGSLVPLGDLGGPTSVAYGINDRDEIVGSSDTSPTFGNPHGFLWRPDTLLDLGTLGGQFSVAFGVNDAGAVVGTGFLPGNTANHAVRWSGGPGQDLGTLGTGVRSVANAINRVGTVVGRSETASASTNHVAFVRPVAGPMQGLGTLGGAKSEATAINDAGLIVGWAEIVSGQRRAFFSTGSGMTDLNALLPGGTSWVLLEARGVNAAGQIVGVGVNAGLTRAFLLSPDPITTSAGATRGTSFAGAFPNPVRDRTQFVLSVASERTARLTLLDVGGRRVKTLLDGHLAAGRHAIAWDGRDESGAALPPGLYLARYEDGSGPAVTRRVSLVR